MQTSTERILQDEIDYLRDERDRLYDEQKKARERSMREWREEHNYQMRQADTWLEALHKQASLCRSKAHLDNTEGRYGPPDTFFTSSADACDQAGKWWVEIANGRQPEIQALLDKIKAIEDEIRMAVALNLLNHERSKESGWKSVADALAEDVDKSNWLNW